MGCGRKMNTKVKKMYQKLLFQFPFASLFGVILTKYES